MHRYIVTYNGTTADNVIIWDGVKNLNLGAGATLVHEDDWTGGYSSGATADKTESDDLRTKMNAEVSAIDAHIARGTFTDAQLRDALLCCLRSCAASGRLHLDRLDQE